MQAPRFDGLARWLSVVGGRRCVRIDRNRNHCGKCRRRCQGGEICQHGECLPLDPTIRASGCSAAPAACEVLMTQMTTTGHHRGSVRT